MEEKNIKYVTIDKIIEYITDPNKSDNDSINTFMLCYRSFITSFDLIKKLKIRYLTPYPIEIKEIEKQLEWIKIELIPIRLKITQILKVWLEHHFYDFNENENLIKEIEIFIELMNKTHGKVFGNSLETTLIKKKKKSKLKISTFIKGYNENIPTKEWNSIFDWVYYRNRPYCICFGPRERRAFSRPLD